MNNEWIARALCANRDPEVFFPDENYVKMDLNTKPDPAVMRAKEVCFRCPVRRECWDDAGRPLFLQVVTSAGTEERIVHDFVGVRAGQVGKERRYLLGAHGQDEAFIRSEERLAIQMNRWGTSRKGAA